MRSDTSLPEISNKIDRVEGLVNAQRQSPGPSGGMEMDHVRRSATFGMPLCLDQVARTIKPERLSINHP